MEYKYFTLNNTKCLLVTIKKVILFEKSTCLLGKINNMSNDRGKINLMLNISTSNKKLYQDNDI